MNLTFGQPMNTRSTKSSTTSSDTVAKATTSMTKGNLTQTDSSSRDSYSLSSSQSNTALRSHNGDYTQQSQSTKVFSSIKSKETSHPGSHLQSSLLSTQTISSSHSVPPISSAASPAASSATTTRTVSMSNVPGFYEILPDGSTTNVEITTTVTSPPPGFSTIATRNSLWTGDTTTVSAGTTYPVIYGCSVCGGEHHGIIIFGLGGKPSDPKRSGCGSGILSIFKSLFGCGSEFKFPPSWGLPPFIVGPSGNPIPEETQPNPNDPEPEPEEEPQTSPEATSPKTTSSQTTSSQTASSQTTSSQITSSQTTFSEVTSSTTSSTIACSAIMTPIPYAVFLHENVSEAELNAVSSYLQEEVGGPDVVAEISLGTRPGDSMFAALIDNCVASKIGAHPSVGKKFPSG